VSREVVLAMAEGALERCPADIVLAITGVAGPEPDEDGNPVGLLHVAAMSRKAARGISNVDMTRLKTRHLPSRDASRIELGR
jgi:nicotinamide mononucleotide (NMN) deamidase PncC